MTFGCTRCGLCCANIGKAIDAGRITNFPFGVTESGACKAFDAKTRLCTVYDSRPAICNVVEFFKKRGQLSSTWKEFANLNARVCNELMDEAESTCERVKYA